MSDQIKIGLLSTIDHPLLPFFISSIASQGLNKIIVIVDSKTESEKDRRIWNERTGGAFERVDGGKASIYSLCSLRIPFFFVENHNDDDSLSIIMGEKVDCLFNAGTPRRVSKRIIESVPHGVVNVHPGLLPRYRGCSAVEWAIFNDEKIGNSAHFMDEGYDTGNIIHSEWYEFPTDADYQSIRVRVYRDGCVLAGKVLKCINKTRMTPNDGLVQDSKNGKYWSPIPDEKFRNVLQKIEAREYKYQIL